MPGMIDVEDNPNGLGQQEVQAWIDHHRDQTGRTPVVYTGAWFWDELVGPQWAPENVPLHVSHYRAEPPGGHGDLRHLERLGDLAVRGRRGPFAGDSNQFFGDQAQWEAFLTPKDYDPVSN